MIKHLKVLIYLLLTGLLLIAGYKMFFMKVNVSLKLDDLVNFQESKDPVNINNYMKQSKEWSTLSLPVGSVAGKSYNWARKKLLKGKPYKAMSIDDLLFVPSTDHEPVIMYHTPSEQVYSSIVREATEKMQLSNEQILNGKAAYNFVSSTTAVQLGETPNGQFSILVMSRKDYDKGVRFF